MQINEGFGGLLRGTKAQGWQLRIVMEGCGLVTIFEGCADHKWQRKKIGLA